MDMPHSDTKVLCFYAGLPISCWIYWTYWQEYFNEPTSCWLSKQTNNSFDSYLWSCDEMKSCGSVGARRSRTYFWIFVLVFCLSLCWFFFVQKSLDFQAFGHLLLLPSSLQSRDPIVCPPYYTIFMPLSARYNSSHYTFFIWQLDGGM